MNKQLYTDRELIEKLRGRCKLYLGVAGALLASNLFILWLWISLVNTINQY